LLVLSSSSHDLTTRSIISGSVYYTTADGNESILQTSIVLFPSHFLFLKYLLLICWTLSNFASIRLVATNHTPSSRHLQEAPLSSGRTALFVTPRPTVWTRFRFRVNFAPVPDLYLFICLIWRIHDSLEPGVCRNKLLSGQRHASINNIFG
jgi:hypothetical protein